MRFPYSSWLIKKLEKTGMNFSDFEQDALEGLLSSNDEGSINIERILSKKGTQQKYLSNKRLGKKLLEENILIEFEPVTKQEYHLILHFYDGLCTVTECIPDYFEENQDATNIFRSYKEGLVMPPKKALSDLIHYFGKK